MDIKGKLIEIYDTKQITGTFSKREFVVEYATNPKYPQYIKFELIQDNCAMIDPYKTGDDIQVFFDLRGRPWTNPQGDKQYFTTLTAWKLEKAEGYESSGNVNNYIPDTGDDMPF